MASTRGIGERGEAGRRTAVQGDARDPPLAVADHDRPPGPQFGGGTLATDGGGLAGSRTGWRRRGCSFETLWGPLALESIDQDG
jgi:hypothetical protein